VDGKVETRVLGRREFWVKVAPKRKGKLISWKVTSIERKELQESRKVFTETKVVF
jgi:hypothetical protein